MKRIVLIASVFSMIVLLGGILLSQTAEEEVEVQAKAEFSIDDAVKPITDVTLEPFEPIDSLLMRKERELELRLPKTIEEEIRKVIKLENLFLRQPVYPQNILAQIPLNLEHYNKKYRKIREWRIDIYDSWGKHLRTYEGKGKLPKVVYWDGKDKSGKPVVEPGMLYHFRIRVKYEKGTRAELSKPFSLKGYFYEQGGYYHIIVDISDVFEKGFAVMREGQEDRIIEALNIIKEHYPWNAGIEITYYPSPDAQMVMGERMNLLKQFIMSRLPIEEGKLNLKPGYYRGGGIKIEKLVIKFK